ncbi:MAG: glycosyltransferase family 4 protein, partial [Pseudobdellovibrionaceae bacterium]|nr:glycosyltransferase family 4 protein [Pseudobdellovibrionaceae bacterium]
LSRRDSRVHVPGFVDDVRPYFQKSTVFVCPITDGGGTRLKILDALAMGMPVVSTTFAASGLDLVQNKHLLLADNPEAFMDAILRLFRNDALRQALSIGGRDIVASTYSWEVVGKKLRDAYTVARQSGSRFSSNL